MRVAKTIELVEPVEGELQVLSRRRAVEARVKQRVLVELLAVEGLPMEAPFVLRASTSRAENVACCLAQARATHCRFFSAPPKFCRHAS